MLLLALCLALADPPLSERVARIGADFAALEKSFDEELHAAKNDGEKVSKANRVYQAKWGKAAGALTDLIKAHPEDASALDGVILLTGAMRWTLDDELTQLALRNRDDARMGRLCFNLMYRGREPWAEVIVKAVAESNPSKEVRGQAVFCRGVQCREAAFPYGEAVPAEERDPLIERARGFFTETATKYADVKSRTARRRLA